MRPLLRLALLSLGLLAVACGPSSDDTSQQQEDPCAPHGHIHRESTGDWCHCDRGYLATEQGLACAQDPDYVPRTDFDFGDQGEHACWHVTNGPFATVTASPERRPRVDSFHTYYTVKLRPEGGQHVGTFDFKGYANGDFIVYLSNASVPVTFREAERTLEPMATAPVPANVCTGLVHMVGYELTQQVQYTLTLGPTPLTELGLVIEHLD